jgi:hypothetical protein
MTEERTGRQGAGGRGGGTKEEEVRADERRDERDKETFEEGTTEAEDTEGTDTDTDGGVDTNARALPESVTASPPTNDLANVSSTSTLEETTDFDKLPPKLATSEATSTFKPSILGALPAIATISALELATSETTARALESGAPCRKILPSTGASKSISGKPAFIAVDVVPNPNGTQ